MRRLIVGSATAVLVATTLVTGIADQGVDQLDSRVQAFLDSHRGTWRDLNVPESDGRILHDLILKHKFTRALEIGTSTGHSGIWIAWALAKTGGKLTTVEIDPGGTGPPSRTSRRPGWRRTSTRAWATHTRLCRRSPGRSTSCSRMPTRTGTRTTWSRSGPRSSRAGASRRTTCLAPEEAFSIPLAPEDASRRGDDLRHVEPRRASRSAASAERVDDRLVGFPYAAVRRGAIGSRRHRA